MAKLNPYLNFDGNCEDAFNYYKKVFGGEFSNFSRMSYLTGEYIPEEDSNLIMHVSLPFNGDILMGSDIPSSMKTQFKSGNNNYISIESDSREEANRLFNELSDGGEVEMPMEEMFWSDYFGSFRDRFGIWWMINLTSN